MREPIGSENTYLVLETGSGLFAVPVCETRGVVISTQEMRPSVSLRMPDYVKCVATVYGQPTIIITLPGDRADTQLLGKPIVILEHPERNIGVIANSVKLIVIPEEGIKVDCLTRIKTYAEGNNIFSVVDTFFYSETRSMIYEDHYHQPGIWQRWTGVGQTPCG